MTSKRPVAKQRVQVQVSEERGRKVEAMLKQVQVSETETARKVEALIRKQDFGPVLFATSSHQRIVI